MIRDFKNFLVDVIHLPLVIGAYVFSLVAFTAAMHLLDLPIAKILAVNLLLTVVYLVASFNIWDDGELKILGNFITLIVAVISTYILLQFFHFQIFYTIAVMVIIVMEYFIGILATSLNMQD